MDVTHPTHHFVQRASFHLLTPDHIRKLSVKVINNAEIFDNLGHPTRGGLYDPALGPIEKNERCSTCGLGSFQCPGHFGHVELAVPVYAPLTFVQMFQLLRQTCLYCHRFRAGILKTQLCIMKLELLDAGFLSEAMGLEDMVHQTSSLPEESEEKVQSDKNECNAIIKRLRAHVNELLSRAQMAGYKRGRGMKLSAVAEYRAKVISEFLKRASSSLLVACPNCRGYIPTLYCHGGVKVFTKSLSGSQKVMMEAKGMNVEHPFQTIDDNEDCDEVKKTTTVGEAEAKGMKFLTPMHVYEHLHRLWKNESTLCQLIFGSQIDQRNAKKLDHRIFFMDVLAVPPCRFRPPSVFGAQRFDHPQNVYLSQIIKLNERIVQLRKEMAEGPKGGKLLEKLDTEATSAQVPAFADLIKTWVLLQEQVNFLFDSSNNPSSNGKTSPSGIKQILEKKEGMFRKHMMGKRVNYAARSVISPDPNLETREIGVPMVFAKKLTFPEPVTAFNVTELRQAVINGPDIHPGAAYVQMEDGSLADLENMSQSARVALANQLRTPSSSTLVPRSENGLAEVSVGGGKRVLRHIRNGDVVLMNRQPTLHKPSIMAHRVRVLPGEKTLRMHYANCNTYNADFDGDEMNMHFPQTELGRAEAYTIANTDNQYLVPTDGSPLRGLIQDHIVSGVLLTLKDTWLNRETYQQLLWGALPETDKRVMVIPPAILKPQPLWSGKQVITTVLLNLADGRPPLNLTSNCKINAKMWGKSHGEEAQVQISAGYLVTGVVDKSQFGASAYGITHAVYELYGPECAGKLLTIIGRLLTRFDQFVGFTCRMDDLMLDEAANLRRQKLIEQSHPIGKKVLIEYAKLTEDDSRKDIMIAMERILRSDELMRGLDGVMKGKMNESTSKIIETCLPDGQYRPFPLNNMSLMTLSGAKGSMVNFSQIAGLLGQQELEGRRVPTMVSGKTHPSFPAFDPRARAGGYITQRFFSGIRAQEFFFHCMAGREGLIDTAVKTSRSGYLQRCLIKHLESLKVHYDNSVRDSDGTILQFHYGEDGLDVVKQKYLRNFAFSARNFEILTFQCQPHVILERVNTEAAVRHSKKAAKKPTKYEPTLAKYSPNVYLGATSERFHLELEKFLSSEEGKHLIAEPAQFRAVMWLRYMKALAEPGEAVGLLAAQSVGEPSTQMTLNTFHFAGFGAKNVTLGIPRLREIIMTASQKIKTPTLTIPLRINSTKSAEDLAKKMSKLTLNQLMSEVEVVERLVPIKSLNHSDGSKGGANRARVYSIKLVMIPLSECKEQFDVTLEEIQNSIENSFVRVLNTLIDKTIKRSKSHSGGANLISFKKTRGQSTNTGSDKVSDEEGRENSTTDNYNDKNSGTNYKEKDDDDDEEEEEEGEGGEQEDDQEAKRALSKQAQIQEDQSDKDEDNDDTDANADDGDGDNDNDSGEYTFTTSTDSKVKVAKNFMNTVGGRDQKMMIDVDNGGNAKTLSSLLLPPQQSSANVKVIASKGSVMEKSPSIRKYRYDSNNNVVTLDLVYPVNVPKLLLLDILERCLGDVIVRQIAGTGRVFPHRDDNSPPTNGGFTGITTEGANIKGIWENFATSEEGHLDLRQLISNDIYAILTNYGVEAARATIMREVAAVFAVYGISVDPRHLSLIADYMTIGGGYRPFNRIGMASSGSPFLQMTFETTVSFLRQAALTGDYDDLQSPSSRLVLGLPVQLGTGIFELRQPVQPFIMENAR